MKKVLIIGPNFHNYNVSMASAFELLGWETVIETYDGPVHPFKGLLKWRHKFSPNRKRLKRKNQEKYNQYIAERFSEIKPDLVFILNGNILMSKTLDFFRKSSKTALWMYDSVRRYVECKDFVDHVDFFFCYDHDDVKRYEKEGRKAYFLPQAYDDAIYKPLRLERDIDLLFVGVLYKSEKRIRYVKSVIENFPDKKILIFGTYKPYYKDFIKWIFREKRHIYKNKNIPGALVNEYYNRSKIVFNIHHESQTEGANPKVFEICGAGAYQICDANPYIKSIFPDGEIGLYNDEQELIARINDAFGNDKTENAEKAHEIVSSKHTFTHRVQEILSVIHE